MSTQTPEQLLKSVAGTSMGPAEHRALRHLLDAYAATYRAPAGAWAFFARHAVAYSLAVVLLGAGTATGFAQQSLPGDFLYPVRLTVNERVEAAVAGDEDAKLYVEAAQVGRAIDEEELVAARDLAEVAADARESEDSREWEEAPEHSSDGSGANRSGPESGSDGIGLDERAMEEELRSLERLLDDEETAATIQLSL